MPQFLLPFPRGLELDSLSHYFMCINPGHPVGNNRGFSCVSYPLGHAEKASEINSEMSHTLRDGPQSRNGSLISSGSSEELTKAVWEPRCPEADSNAQVTGRGRRVPDRPGKQGQGHWF